MSTALAIAAVTQVLRDLLNDRFVNQNVAGMLGQSVAVSTLPPDKVVKQNGVEITQLNLFLRQVTPNIGWLNEGLPSRDNSGRSRLCNPPLALDLHYLISAYGAADLHAEILLGYAMQMLHECPVITREAIRTAIVPAPDSANVLPDWLRALRDSGLESQVEQLRITPEYLSTEDMSKFWTSTLAHYRPSAAYQVSVVLIQAQQPAPSAMPVLVRAIDVRPGIEPWAPTLSAVVPANKQQVVELDTPVTLEGFALDGTSRDVVLTNDRFDIERVVPATGGNATKIQFTIPAASAADFPVGVYRVGARVQRAGETEPRITNELALMLAPHMINLPPVVNTAGGTASFSLDFTPALRVGQVARLVIDSQEYAPQSPAATTTHLGFEIPDAPLGQHLARLRIDGIDSPLIDRSAVPPAYLDRRIEFK